MHVGFYNFLASKRTKQKKKELLSVHVFIAYTPTKIVIMYMYDVFREAQWGKEEKKKKEEETDES